MMHFWLQKSENIALHDEFDVQMRLYISCTLVVHSRASGFTSSHMHHLLELEFYITNLLEATSKNARALQWEENNDGRCKYMCYVQAQCPIMSDQYKPHANYFIHQTSKKCNIQTFIYYLYKSTRGRRTNSSHPSNSRI